MQTPSRKNKKEQKASFINEARYKKHSRKASKARIQEQKQNKSKQERHKKRQNRRSLTRTDGSDVRNKD